MRRVLIVKAGTLGRLRERLGDYDAWFAAMVEEAGAATAIWDARAADPPGGPPPDAVLVTGSSASATDPEPWIARLGELLAAAARAGRPILGVCFGHQLLAQALGGAVARHPAGRELGTVAIELTPAGRTDPLFAGLPPRFLAHATHADHVVRLPPGGVVLAHNAVVPVQAFSVGEAVRGVQFHPEFSAQALRAHAEEHPEKLDREAGPGAAAAAAAGVRETPDARRVVRNFVERFVVAR